jgi:MFS transporter, DHA1 family, multidrug resistance protein
VFGPLSELYGRRTPLFLGHIAFVIFHVSMAVAQDVQTVLISRFLQGFFGCAPLAIVGGALADFWGPVDRAVAIAIFSSVTFGGPAFGPML